jgi:hypothetical protein
MLPAVGLAGYLIAELRNPSSELIEERVLYKRAKFHRSTRILTIYHTLQPLDTCTNIEDPKDQANGTNNNHDSNNDPNNILILLTPA